MKKKRKKRKNAMIHDRQLFETDDCFQLIVKSTKNINFIKLIFTFNLKTKYEHYL